MIPNIVHFVFGLQKDFCNMPFSLVHYLAIKSAWEVNKPKQINFFYTFEPTGEHWELAKPYLNLIPVTPPSEIFKKPLTHTAHQADVLRLLILLQYGGIYLDLDTICTKPFTHLLHHRCVIGQQGTGYRLEGLSNAVLFAEKDSNFISAWLSSYKTFRSQGKDEFWDEHSVKVPLELAPFFTHSGDLHIEPFTSFHYPHYQLHLDHLFEENHPFPHAICHHLWESLTWDKYLKHLTEKAIRTIDTSYNLIARRFLT